MEMLNYWQWIEQEARIMRSDGCTVVSDWHKECCWEHDLACYFMADPRRAYELYCADPLSAYWMNGAEMSRRKADYMFGDCNHEWSITKAGRIRSFLRFLGVRIGAFLNIGRRIAKVDIR